MPESIAAVYTSQMLNGLAYLHRCNVIHRDIKAANVLITTSGTIKLADFGIATVSDEGAVQVDNPIIEGSPFWLAPEIIQLQKPTYACDIWSLGCTIIELITTRPPYFDMPPMSALFKIVQDDHPPLPEELSDIGQKFLIQCFQKQAEDRPQAIQLLQTTWIRNISEENNSQVPTITIEDARASARQPTLVPRKGVQLIDWSTAIDSEDDDSSQDYGSDSSDLSGSWPRSRPAPVQTGSALSQAKNSFGSGRTGSVSSSPSPQRKRKDTPSKYRVLITGFETRKNKLFSYTVFRMRVSFGNDTWTVYKTYNDFKQFHRVLRQKLKRKKVRLPRLPRSRLIGTDKISFIKKRKAKLQKFVEEMLKSSAVMRTGMMINFLKEDGSDAAQRAHTAESSPADSRVESTS
eukprot:TRINITY_DN6110_c0_g1_i1.p1 TRINITY_DN6110_c0_g1~~TRINITY_DN6110_c0_g1_i1.p1  ORF type:complete len:405 (-),score=52.33 TRINITY_DN6110_c0_g1_i1:85-1299(-)